MAQKDFRKIEHDGVKTCLTIYDEALAVFVCMDKYKYWSADHKEAATQPTDTIAEGDDSDEVDVSHTSDLPLKTIFPKYTTGTSKAWSDLAVTVFNNLCGSISSQRSLDGYGEVLELVKKRWFHR